MISMSTAMRESFPLLERAAHARFCSQTAARDELGSDVSAACRQPQALSRRYAPYACAQIHRRCFCSADARRA